MTLRKAVFLLLLFHFQSFSLPSGPLWAETSDWSQWGGPSRNFMLEAGNLADSWPDGGPPLLWNRPLGEGYSGIVFEAGSLYTIFRQQDSEHVIALDPGNGNTQWSFSYEAPLPEGTRPEHGPGPHASPLIAGGLVFTIGATGKLHALNKADGSLVWAHDLLGDFGATFRNRGYSSSPLAYKDWVIVPVGGKGQSLIAFRQSDGTVVWRGGDFDNGHASPILIEMDGRKQLVIFLAAEVAGFDPESGSVLWSHPHETNYGLNISTPVFGKDGRLFISSAYNNGSRVLQLEQTGKGAKATELWFNNRMRVHFGSAIRLGNHIYGSSGDFGPAFLACIEVTSGELIWRDRSFAKATLVQVGEKTILLDEDGILAMVRLSPQGLQVDSRVSIADSRSWTGPTIVGTKMYVRNREEIMAFELGR